MEDYEKHLKAFDAYLVLKKSKKEKIELPMEKIY